MMLIEAAENDLNDELDEVATFITEFFDEPEHEEDTLEFNAWVCEVLDIYDDKNRSQDDYMVDMNALTSRRLWTNSAHTPYSSCKTTFTQHWCTEKHL